MTREDDRYKRRLHGAPADHRSFSNGMAEFFFMDDRRTRLSRRRPCQGQQSARSDGCGRLLRQLQQPIVEPAAARDPLHALRRLAADTPKPGAATVQVRSVAATFEGANASSILSIPTIARFSATKGDFADAWSYDLYGQYFYTKFTDSNQKYLSYEGIGNALLVTGTGRTQPASAAGDVSHITSSRWRS